MHILPNVLNPSCCDGPPYAFLLTLPVHLLCSITCVAGDDSHWQACIQLNLLAPMFLTKAFAPSMVKKKVSAVPVCLLVPTAMHKTPQALQFELLKCVATSCVKSSRPMCLEVLQLLHWLALVNSEQTSLGSGAEFLCDSAASAAPPVRFLSLVYMSLNKLGVALMPGRTADIALVR